MTNPENDVIPGEIVEEEDRPLVLNVAYRPLNDPDHQFIEIKQVALGLAPIILITFSEEANTIEVDATGFNRASLSDTIALLAESIPTLTTTEEK